MFLKQEAFLTVTSLWATCGWLTFSSHSHIKSTLLVKAKLGQTKLHILDIFIESMSSLWDMGGLRLGLIIKAQAELADPLGPLRCLLQIFACSTSSEAQRVFME